MTHEAHKRIITMQYTEEVIYDADGAEITRFRNHDDHTYDESGPEPLTDREIEDYL